ncbi:hypothetical protein ACI78T_13035 [Blastococcus sp. SYSU D00922]
MNGHGVRHHPSTEVGLPEVVGFVIGAGAMATAMAALEASLSGSDRARRIARDGIRAELSRMAAERASTSTSGSRAGPTVTWRHAA